MQFPEAEIERNYLLDYLKRIEKHQKVTSGPLPCRLMLEILDFK